MAMILPIFNREGNCPICKQKFRSEECPHSIDQALDRIHRDEIRKIVQEEIFKKGIRIG